MALHVVLGDGEMTIKELTKTLDDLYAAEQGDPEVWFVVQGKPEPTATDKAMLKWFNTNGVYFEVITDDEESMDEIYEAAAEKYVVKRLSQKVLSILQTKAVDEESGETYPADVLALFVSDDPTAEEDRWVNNAVEAAMNEGFKAFALNDGLVELENESDEPPEEEEEETPPAKPTKAAAKKVGASKKAATKPAPAAEEEEEEEAPAAKAAAVRSKVYTRDELEDLDLKQLKAVAAQHGIELPPRTKTGTYISAILGDDEPPEAEVAEVEVVTSSALNGDLDEVVDQVFALVIERLVEVLQA